MLLELKDVEAGYGKKKVLSRMSINIREGSIVVLAGPNGAGKTTTLKVISGQLHPFEGTVCFGGEEIGHRATYENVRRGISMVPQGGKVFRSLTVMENLEMGGYLLKNQKEVRQSLERVFHLFPILGVRKHQLASTLSGGEQQMLAIGRGLMLAPKLLLLDEPSLGLAPLVLQTLMKAIARVKKEIQNSILIVEQNVNEALKIADEVYGMKLGRIVFHEKHPEKLISDRNLKKTYLA